jgi:hypothetical protein
LTRGSGAAPFCRAEVFRYRAYRADPYKSACCLTEAALAIGILPHSVLVGGIGAKALGSHGFIGLPETFGTRRCGIRFRGFSRDLCAKKRNEKGKSEQRFCVQHIGFLLV